MQTLFKTGNKSKLKSPKFRTNEDMHSCLKKLILTAQFFGIFCLQNITDENVKNLHFKWISLRMAFSLLWFSIHVISFSLCVTVFIYEQTKFHFLVSPLFYLNVVLINLSYLRLAKRWPNFIRNVCDIEENFLRKYTLEKNHLQRKLMFIIWIMFICGIVEHSLATAVRVKSTILTSQINLMGKEGFENYLRKHFDFIFNHIPYHMVIGILVMLGRWIGAFAWVFTDTFLILVCCILAERFKQLKAHIINFNKGLLQTTYVSSTFKMSASTLFWREIREDYSKMTEITQSLNHLLADQVVFSYAFNLMFILIQLFSVMGDIAEISALDIVYFFLSFSYVIFRSVVISISGGWMSEEGKAPLFILHRVQPEFYNEEIIRLIWQIHTTPPTLTGYNFFTVRKGLVLSVAAAVVTYELVLIQFSAQSDQKVIRNLNRTV